MSIEKINIKLAKEIIFKPNSDGTFNITIKYDLYEQETMKVVKELICSYPKAKVNFDIEIFPNDGNCVELEVINF